MTAFESPRRDPPTTPQGTPADAVDTDSNSEAEDWFEEGRASLFQEPVFAQGTPGRTLTYLLPPGPGEGDDVLVHLRMADPTAQATPLMAQYVWKASGCAARLLGTQAYGLRVRGRWVLELGSGSGLLGIQALRLGARHVCVTDWPDPGILEAIRANLEANGTASDPAEGVREARWSVVGLPWGDEGEAMHAVTRIRPRYDLVLASDTLWQEAEQGALLHTLIRFLCPGTGRALLVAGDHTGLRPIATFLRLAVGEPFGLRVLVLAGWCITVAGEVRPWCELAPDQAFVEQVEAARSTLPPRAKPLFVVVLALPAPPSPPV